MIIDVLRVAAIVLFSGVCSAATLLGTSLGRGEEAAARMVARWGRGFIRLGGWSVHVEGMEHLPFGGAVLVSNHQSLVDIPLLLSVFPRPVRFLAKRELGEIFMIGKTMAAAGTLFIDRDDPRDAIRMLRKAASRISAGDLFVIFPEGRRSLDGSIGDFKPGAFYLAQMSGAPLVPVYIDGGFQALPRGARRFRAARLLVRVLPPFPPEEREGETKERIATFVRERILSAAAAGTGEGNA